MYSNPGMLSACRQSVQCRTWASRQCKLSAKSIVHTRYNCASPDGSDKILQVVSNCFAPHVRQPITIKLHIIVANQQSVTMSDLENVAEAYDAMQAQQAAATSEGVQTLRCRYAPKRLRTVQRLMSTTRAHLTAWSSHRSIKHNRATEIDAVAAVAVRAWWPWRAGLPGGAPIGPRGSPLRAQDQYHHTLSQWQCWKCPSSPCPIAGHCRDCRAGQPAFTPTLG